MLFGKYDFKCSLLDDAILPPFKGSTFRGAFGSALKRVVCAVRERECTMCLLSSRCVYARTFELKTCERAAKLRTAALPHPYVIEPPLESGTRFQAGQSFDFSLLLFGDYNDYLPYFIYAFEVMGENGIGKSVSGKRSRFTLESVFMNAEEVYSRETRTLKTLSPPKISVSDIPKADRNGTLDLRLLTPLRLKTDNTLTADLPFHVLIRAALRRISSLFDAYGDGEPALDYRGIVAAAEKVETVRSHLHWHDWERWSNRQEKSMLMGGMVGNITYRGQVAPFIPLLKLSREFHLGKQTSFGLGLVDYSYAQETE
jgi:CRISPR-associated endoribonuclease Cas6